MLERYVSKNYKQWVYVHNSGMNLGRNEVKEGNFGCLLQFNFIGFHEP